GRGRLGVRRGFGNLARGIGAIVLGHRGKRAVGCGLGKVLRKQAAQYCGPRTAAAATHDAPDQEAVAAMHRTYEVEARSAGVAGLDTVDAVDAAEQVIVIGDGLAAETERGGREVAIIAREAILDGAAERRLVARRR